MPRQISLTQGYYAIVDDEDYAYLNRFKWHANVFKDSNANGNRVYAVRWQRNSDGKRIKIRMHRQLMNTPEGMDTDHIDGNGLNNTKANLRVCTRAENVTNAGKRRGAATKYKGAHYHSRLNKWEAHIRVNTKRIYLGIHETEEAAALAYNLAAIQYHGEFARLNPL